MKKHGFTLVEMSIVLVIMGLLVGGILTGQNLVKAAELRAVSNEFNQWQSAVQLFKEKYSALPGDITNATSYWGRADNGTFTGQCAAPNTDLGTGTQTCNGDGDGRVSYNHSVQTYGIFRFWQHLANAGLIEGSYTGRKGGGDSWDTTFGTNAPRSKLSNAGWIIMQYTSYPGSCCGRYVIDYGNYYHVGGAATGTWPGGYPFTPEMAWNVDMKIDDGKPGTGNVVIENWDFCTLAATNADTAAAYDLSNTAYVCRLIFPKAF